MKFFKKLKKIHFDIAVQWSFTGIILAVLWSIKITVIGGIIAGISILCSIIDTIYSVWFYLRYKDKI